MKKNGLYLPDPHTWMFFSGEVSAERLQPLMQVLSRSVKASKAKRVLYMCSYGGDPSMAIAWYDFIRFLDIPLITIAAGEISSSALTVFLSGKERYCLPGTQWYFHPGTPGVHSEHGPKEITGRVKAYAETSKTIYKIMQAETKMSMQRAEELDEQCGVLTVKQAKQLGIVHRELDIQPGSQVLKKSSTALRLVR